MIYAAATVSVVLALILNFEPRYGQKNMLVYLGICSLMGSLTVIMSMINHFEGSIISVLSIVDCRNIGLFGSVICYSAIAPLFDNTMY